ncbi:unnamed protein product [Phytophthora fragariaefolia]|uniref:Unnamed protein product n=1 Tax=Phytophthora fragariaefolia TaxID=1490495 RepID=A0A9W6UCP9_9STRA|nr:unnamed protein product [Phytophthora fragariaefolia]
MEAHHRASRHNSLARASATRVSRSEGDQVPEQIEQLSQRRMSSDQTSDYSLAHLSALMCTIYSPRKTPSIPANAQVQPIRSLSRTASMKTKLNGSRVLRRVRSIRVVYFKESFYEVYGSLGLAMLLAFSLSFFAMIYMTVVQIIPSWTVNFLMDTAPLDNGEFFLMSKPSQAIVVTSALMLSVFACLYLWLIAFMLSYNNETTVDNLAQAPNPKSLSYRIMHMLLPVMKRIQTQTRSTPSNTEVTVASSPPKLRSFENLKQFGLKMNRSSLSSSQTLSFGSRTSSFGQRRASKLIFDFTSVEGTYHRYYVSTSV